MAGGVRWISAGQISPGTARAQDVQHTIEHLPRIRPGTPTSIGTWRRGSKIGFQRGPLGVGQITSRNSHYSFDAAALFVGRALVSLDETVKTLQDNGALVEVIQPDETTLAALAAAGGVLNPAISAPAARAGRLQGGRIVSERISSFWR